MSVEKPHSADRQDSEIDFRQFFSTSTEDTPSSESAPVLPAEHGQSSSDDDTLGKSLKRARIGWPTRTNIIFAAITFTGGLFCAFHFFNSPDPFRVTAIWPRGLLYQRPFALKHDDTIDMFDSVYSPLESRAPVNSAKSADRNARVVADQPPRVAPRNPNSGRSFVPTTNFSPNLSPSRSSGTSRAEAASAQTLNRASTNARSATSPATNRKAKTTQTKTNLSIPGRTARVKSDAQHSKGMSADLKRRGAALNSQRTTRFDDAKRTAQGIKSAPSFSSPAAPIREFTATPRPSFHQSLNISGGRH